MDERAAKREKIDAAMAALLPEIEHDEDLVSLYGELEEALWLRGLLTPLFRGRLDEIVGGPEDGAFELRAEDDTA
jgi:hypothetical protein